MIRPQGKDQEKLASLVGGAMHDAHRLFDLYLELIRHETKQELRQIVRLAGLLAFAVIGCVVGGVLLLSGASRGLAAATPLPLWGAQVLIGVVVLLLALVSWIVARARLRPSEFVPEPLRSDHQPGDS